MMMRSGFKIILPLLFAGACVSGEEDAPSGIDLDDVEGIEEIEEGLTDLTAQCTWTTLGGLLELDLLPTNVAMISKATDGRIVINGFACDAAATSTTVKSLVVTGEAGAQTLILDYMGGTFAMGTATAAGTIVDMLGGDDAVKIRGSKLADTYVFGSTGIAINTDGNKDITVAGSELSVITMSEGNDLFSGAGNLATGNSAFTTALTVYGGGGNDSIRGGTGDDLYFGGDGDDTFLGGAVDDGSDTMDGGAGLLDTVDYALRTVALTVTLDGTANDGEGGLTEADDVETTVENVKGGTAGDTITGSSAANVLSGGAGADTLDGGDGIDTLNGDADNDTISEGSATSGADLINGGAGTDTVSYALRSNTVTVVLNTVADDGEMAEADKVGADVENITGGGGGDTLTGSISANVIGGGAGGDTITGGDGNDTLIGGLGIDTLNGGLGDDLFNEGAVISDADTVNGGAGVDGVTYAARVAAITVIMDGLTGGGEDTEGDKIGLDVENLVGSSTAINTITGNALDNVLEGGELIDIISGLAGDDTLDGGLEDDILDCGAGDGDIMLDLTFDVTSANCEL
jgi:Ca2+-binding RTX toxin-like protein